LRGLETLREAPLQENDRQATVTMKWVKEERVEDGILEKKWRK
jgi:hypothetical protein